MPPAGRHRAAVGRLCRALETVVDAVLAFIALVLPVSCPGCGQLDVALCRACARRFRDATARPFAAEAGAPALPVRPALPVTAAADYRRGPVSSVVLALKDHGRTDLTGPVAAALARAVDVAVDLAVDVAVDVSVDLGMDLGRDAAVDRAGTPAAVQARPRVVLVPVPTTARARHRRGYHPVVLLLRAARRQGLLPPGVVVASCLSVRFRLPAPGSGPPTRAVRQLFSPGSGTSHRGAGRRDRARRLAGSMRTRRALPAADVVLLVDDVLTTGATLGEAARALRSAGGRVHGAAVVAAVPPPATRRAGPGARSASHPVGAGLPTATRNASTADTG